ncbi:hypothetical protein AOLI_G00058720 [Acnodon oligacanthus]
MSSRCLWSLTWSLMDITSLLTCGRFSLFGPQFFAESEQAGRRWVFDYRPTDTRTHRAAASDKEQSRTGRSGGSAAPLWLLQSFMKHRIQQFSAPVNERNSGNKREREYQLKSCRSQTLPHSFNISIAVILKNRAII